MKKESKYASIALVEENSTELNIHDQKSVSIDEVETHGSKSIDYQG